MTSIVAGNDVELRKIADAIHELWFRREAISYDRERRRVVIPLTKAETKRLPVLGLRYETPGDTPAGTLTFEEVEDLHVIDDAETGAYNVNRLVAEPFTGGVRIAMCGGVPIRIEMACRRVAVRFDMP